MRAGEGEVLDVLARWPEGVREPDWSRRADAAGEGGNHDAAVVDEDLELGSRSSKPEKTSRDM